MHSSSVSFAIVAAWLLGCSSSRYEPFAVPEEQFFGTVNAIVLAPVAVPDDFEFAESTLVTIDSLVEAGLVAAGFVTVPSTSYDEVWSRILGQIGLLYDPETGAQDVEKLEIAREQLFVDLEEFYHPDAVLFPEIQIVDAQFTDGVAKWDGTSEPLIGFGSRIFAAFTAMFGANHPIGSVEALSLAVVVQDMSGEELFMNAGGIQVLQKLKSNGSFREVPEAKLLADDERNRKAVKRALEPLIKKRD